jgi:YXWGXW repeat-containing protein
MQVSTKINREGTDMRNHRRVLPILITAAIVLSGVANAASQVITDVAPPLPKAERAPPPRDGYVWGAGYWEWSKNSYYWVPGHWVIERRSAHWVADHWEQAGSQWHYVAGHWER